MKSGHLSKKEFENQCNYKSMNCKRTVQCYIHEGRKNLKKIRNGLQKIKPDHKGWKTGIKWNIEKKGSLETLINFQHLREDLIKTKIMVDNFNANRLKLQKFIQEINSLLEIKTKINNDMQVKKRKKLGISTQIPKFKKCLQVKMFTSKSKFSFRRNII